MNTVSSAVQPIGVVAAKANPQVTRALGHVLVWSALTIAAFATIVLIGLDGWSYYTAPRTVRGHLPAHVWLRPSGAAGHMFGIAGFVMMLVPVVYSVRKKVRRFRNSGSMKSWLEVHVFCGIAGPALVTFHASFKFNGVVSVAYWSMIAVASSGFVGRYLYVRIPRSLRGIELTTSELDERARQLSADLAEAALPAAMLEKVAAFERSVEPPHGRPLSAAGLVMGELRMRRAHERLRREIAAAGVAPDLLRAAAHLIAERATLLRQAAYLAKTKRLFDLWHVFHMPLVYVMFAIVVVHVAVTVYLGYVPFGY